MFGVTSSRSGSDIFSLLSLSGGIWLSLTLVAFIAAIVCTVLLYRKYVSEPGASKVPGAKHDFGPFLRFEKFWSEKSLSFFSFTTCALLLLAVRRRPFRFFQQSHIVLLEHSLG